MLVKTLCSAFAVSSLIMADSEDALVSLILLNYCFIQIKKKKINTRGMTCDYSRPNRVTLKGFAKKPTAGRSTQREQRAFLAGFPVTRRTDCTYARDVTRHITSRNAGQCPPFDGCNVDNVALVHSLTLLK
ncbi:jg23916 [Pararge aegeria aegeria]|uniref:Jg23916 protein n=1 Tax=Pararge aegeria aegeria TaxID=348720 RepID=A0A8S4S2M1_9NEOP|nr:jg23916 [Pararge aegeria aegeria]